MRETQLGYYEALKNITEDPKYLYGRPDFAVVLQPHMRDMEPPKDVQFQLGSFREIQISF